MMGITLFSCIGFLAAIGCTGLYDRKGSFLKPFVYGTVFYGFCYVLWSMVLFVINQFSLFRAVLGTAILLTVLLFTTCLTLRKKHGTLIRLLHWDTNIQTVWIPLIVVLLGLPLILTKNELFGMGQDEGVYQVVAINLMNGYTERQHDFSEYYTLSGADQTAFADAIKKYLVGYDIASANYPETVYDRNVSTVSGIYHGIPTYPAMLALFGKLFGVENMLHLETVIWVCMIFLIAFFCQQMQWKKLTEFIACAVCAISPVIMWVTKSSLTELFLTVILLAFLILITVPNRSHYLSILPIAVFGCYHVSIYTMVPLFVILYGALYLFRREKQYAILMHSTIVLYLISYFSMRHVQPFYTMNNYRFLFVGGITVFNITKVVTIVSVVALVLSFGYCLILHRRASTFQAAQFLQQVQEKRWVKVLFSLFMLLPVAYILAKALMHCTLGELRYLTLTGFAIQTGFFLLPVVCIILLFRMKYVLEKPEHLILFAMFLYCVLVYSAFLRFQIDYYYYYARYLAPFIPIAVLFAAMILDKCNWKVGVSLLTAGVVVLAPFDRFLATAKDDTRMDWSILLDLSEKVVAEDCVIVDTDLMAALYLPIRSMTGAAMYPEAEDATTQIEQLSKQYDTVYYLTNDTSILQYSDSYRCVYRNTAHHSEDDLTQHGKLFPLPTAFLQYEEPICLYQYTANRWSYPADDCYETEYVGFGALEGDFCWSVATDASVFCTLHPDNYTLQFEMGCSIPLEQLGVEELSFSVYINDMLAGELVINEENNGGTLSLPVSSLLLKDNAQNQITIHGNLWSASIVNANDTRQLGFPLKALRFVQDASE
jgi:hypothetical protein